LHTNAMRVRFQNTSNTFFLVVQMICDISDDHLFIV